MSHNQAATRAGVDTPRPVTFASDLSRRTRCISANTKNNEVFAIFDADPTLQSLPVLDENKIVGLINRERFMGRMAGRFHWEVFSKKRCTKMMDLDPLIVDAATTIHDLASLLLGSGSPHTLSDSFIIARAGELLGIGHSGDVLSSLLALERQASEELRDHRNRLTEMVDVRTAALLIAKEEAEAANRAKTTFLANMSHELRTPLHGIMGMTDLALRRSTDPRQKTQLDKAVNASRHLLTVINDILDISKIEADRLSLEDAPFALNDVIANMSNLMAPKATEKGLSFVVDMAPALNQLPLVGDPFRLGQIILNLASNAVKFTAAGTVAITISLAEEIPSGLLIRIEVRDTGIGIAVEDQHRLFSAFEQVDGSMTRKYGGTGLGLAISKRLTQMMGGEIGVDSERGVGSNFWFTARLKTGLASTGEQPVEVFCTAESALINRHREKSVLLVEDELINREVTQELLKGIFSTIDVAEDGRQAIDRVLHKDYDLILMDMQMPNLNGLDATRQIRALPNGATIRIIALTANAFVDDKARCLDAGMDDFATKPVDPDVLFSTMLRCLER